MSSPPIINLGGAAEPHRGPTRRGIEAWTGSAGSTSPLRASRKLRHLPQAPEVSDPGYLGWLAGVVRSKPGAVLLPCNDDHAWWLARNAEEVAALPDAGPLAVAPFDAIRTASVKSRMMAAAAQAGIATPKTVLLAGEDAIAEALAQLRFPLVLKPQMRIGMQHWTRGRVVRNERELREAFAWYQREVTFEADVLAAAPEAAFPLAQEYIVRPGREVQHITGYLARSGEHALRAHRKLLQEPLRFGSGVCFESTAVDEALAGRLLEMLREIGYHGIFEAEFLPHGEEHLLIDLNVRPYNGLSLTLASGLDQVTCAYLEATGQAEALSAELQAARSTPYVPFAWCSHAALATLLTGQLISGGLSAKEARRHLAWAWRNRSHMVNPWMSRDDLPLASASLVRHAASAVMRPRDFLGRYFRTGLDR